MLVKVYDFFPWLMYGRVMQPCLELQRNVPAGGLSVLSLTLRVSELRNLCERDTFNFVINIVSEIVSKLQSTLEPKYLKKTKRIHSTDLKTSSMFYPTDFLIHIRDVDTTSTGKQHQHNTDTDRNHAAQWW